MARRNYDWFYAAAPEKLLMSASQYRLIDPDENPCWRFYGFKHLEKVKEPQGESAAKGDGLHEELELWGKLKRLPKSPAALKAMRYGPAPGMAEYEVPVYFFVDEIGFVGFIDVVYDWEKTAAICDGKVVKGGRVRPLGSTGHTVIHDWKFTSNLGNAMTPEALRKDPAANMYAYEAFLGGAQRVSCRWVYTTFAASNTTKEVWCEMKWDQVHAFVHKMVDNVRVAWDKRRAFRRGELKVLELPIQTTHCFDFKRPCPYKSVQDPERPHLVCNPTCGIHMPAPPGDQKMSEAFRQSLMNFPGVQTAGVPAVPAKAPPAVPPKAAAPAVPPKLPVVPKGPPAKPTQEEDISDAEAQALAAHHLKAQGKDPSFASAPGPTVESGFVNNPRYAPSVPARSPEHAAELQNIKKPEPPAPVVDELNELTKDQLVALALAENPECKASKRHREDTLRNMIRLGRVNRGGTAAPIEVPAPTSAELRAVAREEGPVSIKVNGEEVPHAPAGMPEKPPAALVAMLSEPFVPPAVPAKAAASAPVLSEPAPGVTWPRMLVLDQIIDAANIKLATVGYTTARGDVVTARDWREIPYESGAALNLTVYDLFKKVELKADVVIFDSTTPEGSVLKSTLMSLARENLFDLVQGDLLVRR